MWNKMIKEVKTGRVAGPYKQPPYDYFVQSPVGLVPKAGNKTRLIFHLSYEFETGEGSINSWIPEDVCSVKYNDLDHAIQNCLELVKRTGIKSIFYSKSDLMSAFRGLPILIRHRKYLLMAIFHPITKEKFFFVEKNLPFGSSISCSHFTRFSNCLRHLVEFNLGRHYVITNYLDDFLFIDNTKEGSDHMVRVFLQICEQINFPVSLEENRMGLTEDDILRHITRWCKLKNVYPGRKENKAVKHDSEILE